MQTLLDVPAPAKLNLFLHVTGRRPDGYHLLQSVFMLLDWCDTLHFERRAGGRISREDLGPALPPDDLTTRAAHALRQATGCTDGVHISIDKQIPAQAGLGGGSSDAATTLLALNRLWHLGLNRAELSTIGHSLGADLPFFLSGSNAWVEGTGEKITPIELPKAHFVVLKPPVGLDTGAVYQAPDLKRDSASAIIRCFAADPFGFGQNDLQPVAQRVCPEITEALEMLAQWGFAGRMTGSGSAVFAYLPDTADNLPLMEQARQHGWQARICNNLDAHPLGGWVTTTE